MDRDKPAKGAGAVDGWKEKTSMVEIIVPLIHGGMHLAEADRMITTQLIPDVNPLERELLVTIRRCLESRL